MIRLVKGKEDKQNGKKENCRWKLENEHDSKLRKNVHCSLVKGKPSVLHTGEVQKLLNHL